MRSVKFLPLLLKVGLLTVILFVCFALASPLAGPPAGAAGTEADAAGRVALALLAVCLLDTAVLTHLILRSKWRGWRLAATVFFVFYGTMTAMSQIESAFFLTRLPEGLLPRLFLMGLVVAALYSPLAVLTLGKMTRPAATERLNERLMMPAGEWAWKLAVIMIAYVALYFTFGYFVAWRSPEVRAYYGGSSGDNFLSHMGVVLRETPGLPPLQGLRALLWTLLALPVVRMMRGPWWEAALAVGLLFAVVMNAQLLLPNPYMPGPVRMAHLAETAPSNFIFGWLIVWLLNRHHASPRDLFGAERPRLTAA